MLPASSDFAKGGVSATGLCLSLGRRSALLDRSSAGIGREAQRIARDARLVFLLALPVLTCDTDRPAVQDRHASGMVRLIVLSFIVKIKSRPEDRLLCNITPYCKVIYCPRSANYFLYLALKIACQFLVNASKRDERPLCRIQMDFSDRCLTALNFTYAVDDDPVSFANSSSKSAETSFILLKI